MPTSDRKGAVAESAIAHAAIKHGLDVYRALSDGTRYDLIFDAGSRFVRVRCKWAPRHGDVAVVRCYSSRRARAGVTRRFYTAAEVDAIAAYCPEVDACFLVPSSRFDGCCQLSLRFGASRNNQRLGINWASDFALDATLDALLGP